MLDNLHNEFQVKIMIKWYYLLKIQHQSYVLIIIFNEWNNFMNQFPFRNEHLIRRVSLVEQELFTLPGHLSSPPVFSGVRVTRSLVLYVCFVDRCLSFCTFCVVCSSSIYGFWLPLWYLQTLLPTKYCYFSYIINFDDTLELPPA